MKHFFKLVSTMTFSWLVSHASAADLDLSPAVKGTNAPATELAQMSLEDLMKIEVTSVSRGPQQVGQAPAAITVITGDDIRRSGAISIPQALRLVPGLDVARSDSQDWAISSRGFNDIFADKLLVMMDGRTIYTPLFSGVFWDVQDTMIEDIDRIEVVRGPGATLWGANAVNGVINIITKSAKDTQGLLMTGGGGNEERGFGGVRYGVKFNDDTYFRVYGKYFERSPEVLADGSDADDRWHMAQGGFRLDWQPQSANLVTFQGDIYSGTANQTYTIPTFSPPFAAKIGSKDGLSGGNLLGRWTHTFSEDSEITVQTYYDRTQRHTEIFGEDLDTGDIDFQHRVKLGERNDLTWGAGYRANHDLVRNTTSVSLNPSSKTFTVYSGFVQDEITLQPDHWFVTPGTKLEHNDFTGFEIQPSIRLLWTPQTNHAAWAAISRAVRTPSRAEEDITINPPGVPPGTAAIHGNRDFDSENLIAYEIGYRVQPHPKISLDASAFYNDYSDLRSFEPTGVGLNTIVENELTGDTYGFELSATYQALEYWRLTASYSFLEMQLHRKPGSLDTTSTASERSSPESQVILRSSLDLGKHVQFDQLARYVSPIVVSGIRIPSYWTLEARLAWKPNRHWEFEVVGQNLVEQRHAEFAPTFIATQPIDIERSIFGRITFWY